MESVLKFDRVVLIKELNEKIYKVGESFEIANVLENSFVLREAKSKVIVGVISFEDFEKHFVHEENFKGWTKWTLFYGFDGQNDCMYRTNGKKVQVHFLTDKVRAEACCHKGDDFDLSFGLKVAYLRGYCKALEKKAIRYEEELEVMNREIIDTCKTIQKMINSLPA